MNQDYDKVVGGMIASAAEALLKRAFTPEALVAGHVLASTGDLEKLFDVSDRMFDLLAESGLTRGELITLLLTAAASYAEVGTGGEYRARREELYAAALAALALLLTARSAGGPTWRTQGGEGEA